MEQRKLVALKRVHILMEEAEKAFAQHPERSHLYVKQARTLAMKVRLKLPRSLKRRFCTHCYHYLKPGVNCRVRTRRKMVVTFCVFCKNYMRYRLA